MRQRDRHAIERQRLVIGIEPQRHRGAGAEPGEQEIVRAGPAIEAAGRDRLVGDQLMRADRRWSGGTCPCGFPAPPPCAALGSRLLEPQRRGSARPRPRSRWRRRPHRCAWSADDRRRSSETKLLGCLAATKILVALSMPTVSSVGEWKINSALCSLATRSISSARRCRRGIRAGCGTAAPRARPRPRPARGCRRDAP